MSIIIGIDHGYYAIKTAHCSFPARLTSYGEHEPCGCLSFTIFLCLIAYIGAGATLVRSFSDTFTV